MSGEAVLGKPATAHEAIRSTWDGSTPPAVQPLCHWSTPAPYMLTLLTGVFAAQIILLVVALVALLALCRTTDAQGAALELSGTPRALLRRGRGADDGPNHNKNDDKGGLRGQGRHLLGRCTTDTQCGFPKKKCVNNRCEDNIDDNSAGH